MSIQLLTPAGGGPGPVSGFAPTVTVDSTSTVSSGGTNDWHGRAAIKRRPSDDALVLTYKRATAHAQNDGSLHIRFSDDHGQTWTAEDTDLTGTPVSGFPINPPDAGSSEDAGEPWLYVTPDGDLLLHMWRVDYGGSENGCYQSRSTDGGQTWSTPERITFAGVDAADQDHTFTTDDDFVHDRTIYAGARVHNQAGPTDSYVILVKSDNNGATWEHVSDVTGPTSDTQEIGLEYVGNSTIVGVIRSLNNSRTLQAVSRDMGQTWTVTDVSSTVEVSGRHRIYTRAHLQGETGWWKDPVLVMVGFELTNPGSSQGRRNCVWASHDRGTTWDGPHYIAAGSEDGGYGDMFYDPVADQWVVVTYRGTLAAASLVQYRLTIDGL